MTDRVDCVVIGAGVVGLAVARACALAGWETILIEAEHAIGTGTSSRNSEVIHAGIYYPRGSLKARLCVEGRRALYAYCDSHGIPHRRCGKLIVATRDEQVEALRRIGAAAAANGMDDLRWLQRGQAQALEPALHCIAALESPSTGIIDSHGLMLALQGDFETAGGMLAFRSPVTGGQVLGDGSGILLRTGGDEPMELLATRTVNCAGLQAQTVAAAIVGVPAASIPPGRYAKGNYYSLSGAAPFSRLIYPIPEPGGLGVHLTLDLGGQARFGPDVEWIDALDYTVDPARAEGFYAAIRHYWPGLPDAALQPGYAGIRPKLAVPAGQDADFVIQGARAHGVPGLVNLYGIESPGLTACLAIAGEVMRRLEAP
ncbi:NAD(P)/FAD-dependent oxidoreductase [Castellaniella defragrans]|uniref:Aminobutyraldehyde dehydrogenase n=1 Tax=Castellaniella defragrans (strain DSM 12143 / CCUG 39792 / 65Phen) TaxID=1437824 RepID=W8X1C4_CASD6|nr:NAD(P)/FAD-dependent oxidoreductase [Castellaniella defragrans]CDM22676.1 Aminobutyraldehyde dehydrogenase [Castellaniella defragrans 65Phen]